MNISNSLVDLATKLALRAQRIKQCYPTTNLLISLWDLIPTNVRHQHNWWNSNNARYAIKKVTSSSNTYGIALLSGAGLMISGHIKNMFGPWCDICHCWLWLSSPSVWTEECFNHTNYVNNNMHLLVDNKNQTTNLHQECVYVAS